METGLKGRAVLITGASRNMGRAAALAFAQEGANLALCTSRKMAELGAVADEARSLGVRVVAVQCDVTDSAAVAAFVKRAREKLGAVDVAINIAGYRNEAKFLEGSPEAWARNIEVNLNGPFNVCRSVIPLMIERRWGRIINLSGIAPYIGEGAAKSTVKLGIVGFTRGLARASSPGTTLRRTASAREPSAAASATRTKVRRNCARGSRCEGRADPRRSLR